MKLSKKQVQLLQFIQAFTTQHAYSPTYREIMRGLGYRSVATVAKHVDNLVAAGVIVKRDGEARSLEIAVTSTECEALGSRDTPHESVFDGCRWLRAEIARREGASDEARQQELEVLRRALEILRSSEKTSSGETLHTA